MRVGWIRDCEIRIHPLFAAALLLAAACDQLPEMSLSFAAVLYHELMHVLAATLLGYPVTALELLPFGSSARIEGLYEQSPQAEFLIALAGPASNVLMVMALTTLESYLGMHFPGQDRFIRSNLLLAVFNLLPLWPMDGGRVLRSLLAGHMSLAKATRWASALGIGGGLLMAASALARPLDMIRRISLFMIALMVIASAAREGRQAQWLRLREMTDKKRRMIRDEMLPIRHIAVRGDMELGALTRRFLPHRYHLITVLNEELVPVATIGENEVVEEMMKKGSHTRIFSILSTNT